METWSSTIIPISIVLSSIFIMFMPSTVGRRIGGPVPRASPRMVMLERPVRLNIKAQQDDAYCVPDIVESSSSIAIHPATLIVYHKLFPVFDC